MILGLVYLISGCGISPQTNVTNDTQTKTNQENQLTHAVSKQPKPTSKKVSSDQTEQNNEQAINKQLNDIDHLMNDLKEQDVQITTK